MTTELAPLDIASLHHDYRVTFHHRLADAIEPLLDIAESVCIVDRNVAEVHQDALAPLLTTRPTLLVDALESTKTLDGVESLIDWMLEQGCTRSSTVIGIGGGIIQDVITFTSHVYYRGVRFVLLPTTLLSMCDSCIGAKCGINHGSFKNQLGVLHAPNEVHIATPFLDTLADADIRSGYGEIVKLFLTENATDIDWVIDTVDRQGLRGPDLIAMIRRSLEIKKVIIEEDEYEADLRRILNYGHTFGHALEALTEHAVPHGLGVAWGIDLINHLSVRRGFPVAEFTQRLHDFIDRHLGFQLESFPSAEELIDMTRRDKKVAAGQLNLVLLNGPGDLVIEPTPFGDDLLEGVRDFLESTSAVRRG